MSDQEFLAEIENDTLPTKWIWTTLEEIAEVSRERRDPQQNPDLPFIGMEHVEAHTRRIIDTVPAGEMKSSAEYFAAGDLLYGRLRPYLNKVTIPDFDGLCSAEFIVFRRLENLDNKYLMYLLNSWEFVNFASHLNEGDRPRVGFDQLAGYMVPLAPLNEQRRIVEAIEALFSRLDAGIAALKRAQVNLKRYKASVLKAACEGRLVPQDPNDEPASKLLARILDERRAKWEAEELAQYEVQGRNPPRNWRDRYQEPQPPDTSNLSELPEGWVWASVDELADHADRSITDGPFGSKLKTEHYTEEGPRVIRLQNIGDGEFVDSDHARISFEHFETLRNHEVFAGNLVIAALGEDLPRSCQIPDYIGLAVVKADCVKFQSHPAIAVREYLNAALNSDTVRKPASHIVHGVGRPRLNQQQIKSLPIPLPPFNEQCRIVDTLDRILPNVANIDELVKANLRRIERLRQSILKEAFAGRLVPQDPDDEPASVLIERIRAERAARKG